MLQGSGGFIVGGLRLESRNLVRKYIQRFMLEAMRTQDNVVAEEMERRNG